MKSLVIGGAGFIGSHVVDELVHAGHEVVIFDNFSTGRNENLQHLEGNPDVEIVRGDILDADAVGDVFEDYDIQYVFHLAAKISVQDSIQNPLDTHHTNVDGTLNILEAARETDVQRVVFTSSGSVYGEPDTMPTNELALPLPISPYALSKLIGEHYARLYSLLYELETVSLRYANVYGPRQVPGSGYAALIPIVITKIMHNERPVIFGDGEQTRDFVYVGDVARANLAAATAGADAVGLAVNIGSGVETSVNTIVHTLLEVTGADLTPDFGPAVVEVRRSLPDLTRSKDLLGWEAEVALSDGLKAVWEYYQEYADRD